LHGLGATNLLRIGLNVGVCIALLVRFIDTGRRLVVITPSGRTGSPRLIVLVFFFALSRSSVVRQ
jgi:hypothetical protein